MRLYLAYHGAYAHEIIDLLFAGPENMTEGGRPAMRCYLAGGIQANLKPYWKALLETGDRREAMRIFLAGTYPRKFVVEETVNGGAVKKYADRADFYGDAMKLQRPYILESFFYADKDTERLIPYFGDFLLDSGAYTFFTSGKNKHQTFDWDDYLRRYADFINRNNVEKFFELDIDQIIGYDRVLKLREKLEALTGRRCIPVWHSNRGKEEFLRMCREYDYVAIGGLVGAGKTSEYARKYQKFFTWFIDKAHENGAKIHGLGFTQIPALRQYHFDSVDSTSWTTGNRFGHIYRFTGRDIEVFQAPPGHRIENSREAALRNFIEWVKFQQYADKHL